MDNEQMNNEQMAFTLILHSGNARSLAHEALDLLKADQQSEANDKLKEARQELVEAQKMHARFLRDMACGENIPIDLLLVHAEDHVCSSQTCLEMAEEVAFMYQKFGGQQYVAA